VVARIRYKQVVSPSVDGDSRGLIEKRARADAVGKCGRAPSCNCCHLATGRNPAYAVVTEVGYKGGAAQGVNSDAAGAVEQSQRADAIGKRPCPAPRKRAHHPTGRHHAYAVI
jgi:hypothetical protein